MKEKGRLALLAHSANEPLQDMDVLKLICFQVPPGVLDLLRAGIHHQALQLGGFQLMTKPASELPYIAAEVSKRADAGGHGRDRVERPLVGHFHGQSEAFEPRREVAEAASGQCFRDGASAGATSCLTGGTEALSRSSERPPNRPV